MYIAYKAKKKGAQNERLDSCWCYMLIVGNHHLLADAAYIAAWMIDYCNLIGRKVVFEPLGLVFEAVLHSFLNESEPWGILYPQWSSPIFYPATKV